MAPPLALRVPDESLTTPPTAVRDELPVISTRPVLVNTPLPSRPDPSPMFIVPVLFQLPVYETPPSMITPPLPLPVAWIVPGAPPLLPPAPRLPLWSVSAPLLALIVMLPPAPPLPTTL